MTSQGEQSSELFYFFLELHKSGGIEDDQARALPCFLPCWVPQRHPCPRDKQGFKGPLRPW